MSVNDIAFVYASSLVEIGREKKILSDLEDEIKSLSSVIEGDADFKKYLYSPQFSKESKKGTVKKCFSGNFSEYTINLLCVMIENDRQSVLIDVINSFVSLLDEMNNRARVTITSNEKLDNATVDSIAVQLNSIYKKEIIIKEKIDESIIGGIIINIGDIVIDGSISKEIKKIRTSLLNSKVRSDMAYED